MNQTDFIIKCKKNFPQYDYSKVIYKNSKHLIIVGCPIHGDFEIKPEYLTYYGYGCPECRKQLKRAKSIDTNEFIKRCEVTHPNKYIYSKTLYTTMKSKVTVTCKKHGDFETIPMNFLRGANCPECAKKIGKNKRILGIDKFMEKANQIHNNTYDYSKSVYVDSYSKITITCNVSEPGQNPHGDFEQFVNNHLSGQGCPKCNNKVQKMTTEIYIDRVKKLHPNKQYIFDKTIYTGHSEKITIGCPIHGYFETHANNFINIGRNSDCPKCSFERLKDFRISKSEQEIVDYIKSVYSGSVEQSNRSIISGKELDIYLPEINVAIEFNGLYWHNENNKSNNYHVQKTNDCEKQNIHLVQIFENEWLHKQEIVKSRLKQILGVNKDKRIYGRQCIIRELDAPTERMFMNNNHLQGYVASKVCYGLLYKASNEKEYLVAVMSFGSLRRNLGSSNVDGCYELYRFCNIKNHSVVGGANKLFKHFLKTFKPKKIISFANRRYSFINKNIYQNLGFTFESTTPPSYYYIQGTKLINRFALRKDVLVREYGCPENMSEREFCNEQGWFRIYDAGNLRYIYESKE